MKPLIGVLLGTMLLAGPALAQPADRPLRIVAGFAPGGTSDIVARVVADGVAAALGSAAEVSGAEVSAEADEVAGAASGSSPPPHADSARTADSGRARAVNGRPAVRIVLHSEFGQGCLT